jgi:hypothetical protein
VLYLLRQRKRPHDFDQIVGLGMKLQPDLVVVELPAWTARGSTGGRSWPP